MVNRTVWLLALVSVVVYLSGCLGDTNNLIDDPTLEIRDAYCDGNGHFNFTLISHRNGIVPIEYRWTLNDPKADEPVIRGDGIVQLRQEEAEEISIVIDGEDGEPIEYDSRFYVMYITLYIEKEPKEEYREQKSTYDWDYSTLPPTQID